MSIWLVIKEQQFSENTSAYGFGDYPDQIPYIAALVVGATKRKAQAAARKALPGTRFGGMFSPRLVRTVDPEAKQYLAPADYRLSDKATERHNISLAVLATY